MEITYKKGFPMQIVKQGQVALGIDIGNVITGDTDKSVLFTDNYLQIPEIEGAFESIAELVKRFKGLVYLVSKCGGSVQVKTRHWLSYHGFFEATGIELDHVFFCEKREGKHVICSQLNVTHFIDDRLEVLGYLKNVRHKFLFRPNEKEIARNHQYLSSVVRVENWKDLMEKI